MNEPLLCQSSANGIPATHTMLPKGIPGVAVKFLGFGGGTVNLALDVVSILVPVFCELSEPDGLGIWGFWICTWLCQRKPVHTNSRFFESQAYRLAVCGHRGGERLGSHQLPLTVALTECWRGR